MKTVFYIRFKHFEFDDIKHDSFIVETSSLINMITQLYDNPQFREFIVTGYFPKSFEISNK